MIGQTVQTGEILHFTGERLRCYVELLKPRLSFLVAFSSVFGFVLGSPGVLNWTSLIMLGLGGFLVSGASVTINQIIERNLDALMTRTKNRPLPANRISKIEAIWVAVVALGLGTVLLIQFTNTLTVLLSLISVVLYSFVYTPLKRVGPIAVFVGAIPGALPPLLGWIAATGSISYHGFGSVWHSVHMAIPTFLGDRLGLKR